MIEISAKTPVEELVETFPKAVRILAKHNVVCIRCGEPYWGTLGELAADKGITDLDPILDDLWAALRDLEIPNTTKAAPKRRRK